MTPEHLALGARTDPTLRRPRSAIAGVASCAAAMLLLAGCASRPSYQPRALADDELRTVREQVRQHAKTHCGMCHQASLPTARPAALAIYNLDRDDWSTTLTEQRLRNGFPRRLNAQLDAEGRQQLRRFIEAELALRAAR